RATILHAVRNCRAVYTGGRPTPEAVMLPGATSATTGAQVREGFQFMGAQQQQEYFAGCVYVRDIHRILTPDGSLLKQEQINAVYGGYVFSLDAMNDKTTKSAWEIITSSQAIRFPKVHSTCFRPEL